MNKLIRANLSRLFRSKSFWIGVAAMLLYGVVLCISKYQDKLQGFEAVFESVLFAPYIVVGILVAVFCSLFIGTEYSDGTIRNKLVVGHSRASIYFSNFVVSAVAGLIMNLVYLIVACGLGIPLLGFTIADLPILLLLLAGLLMTFAFAAVFTLLAMLNQNKALVAIISVVCIFAALIFSGYMYGRLMEPEFQNSASVTVTSDGQTITQHGGLFPNPLYLNDTQRAQVQFISDFLPTGQAVQLFARDVPNAGLMLLYSGVIIVLANAAGMFFFRRKDLK